MQLFRRRPLCLFCTIFALTSLATVNIDYKFKCIVLFFITAISILLIILGFAWKKYSIRILAIILCLLSALGAVTNSFFRIDLKSRMAEEYVGNRIVVFDIIDEKYKSNYSSTYSVKLRQIDDEESSFKALAVFSFYNELSVGDRIYAKSVVYSKNDTENGVSAYDSDSTSDAVLLIALENEDAVLVEKFDREQPLYKRIFQQNGINTVIYDMKSTLENRIFKLFGGKNGSLVKGFLLGDTSDISTDVIRDFRRSGVSHLLAVSGMHISILLGAIDLLLKKIYVHKNIRCIIVTLFSFVFLALVGFSMSAIRAVFMLWLAFIIYMFSEEADSPTILFVALVMMLIVSPYSVYSLGMWMSFLATLGLVTVYPFFEKIIPVFKHRSKIIRYIFKLLRSSILISAMTIISNIFLLPIQWKYFGELSTISIPANIILSPISTVYMILSVVAIAFGGIPVISEILIGIVGFFSKTIFWIANKLSISELATVSMEYWFTDFLVIAFVVLMLIFMIIKLPKKWLLGIPFAVFTVAFGLCVVSYNCSRPQVISYSAYDTQKNFSIYEAGKMCIVDLSKGEYTNFSSSYRQSKKFGATDVDMIVFTKITKNHISSMDYFFRTTLVKEIYIPIPDKNNKEDIDLAIALTKLANDCEIQVNLYENGDFLKLDRIRFLIDTEGGNSLFASGGKELFGYVDCSALKDNEKLKKYILETDTLIIGEGLIQNDNFYCQISDDTTLIYSSENIMKRSNIKSDIEKTYYNNRKKLCIQFELK